MITCSIIVAFFLILYYWFYLFVPALFDSKLQSQQVNFMFLIFVCVGMFCFVVFAEEIIVCECSFQNITYIYTINSEQERNNIYQKIVTGIRIRKKIIQDLWFIFLVVVVVKGSIYVEFNKGYQQLV
eukprot:TRINITY_DN4082_c0_g2_i1.p2 TRINITY_DN4082_c0_g2~~TRINITY_DN4082_c0_g2_i1.p2  ORF type:complete len:127 (-),score=1.29 TRINITY_DN4082_c0_g2_i1:522-902(-)